jgi:spore maturation protein CgeB
MLKKACFLVNYNLYESKRYFTQKLAEAMERKGIDTQIIDLQEQVLGGYIMAVIKQYSPDLTISFNTLLPSAEEKFLWDLLKIPHLAILVDPVIYSIQLIKSPFSILSSVDRSDVASVRAYPFENIFFLPHAIEPELVPDYSQKKIYDVVFLGSCCDYESLRASWRQRNPESINKVLDEAIDIVFSETATPLADALARAWQASGMDPSGMDFTTLFYYLDNYTRGRDRVELIRSIKDSPVHVFGEISHDNAVGILGWSEYLSAQKNVTLHPSVPFPEALKILQQSKITLNSMPFFKNGSHERVFAGLACGAVPVTSDSLYLRDVFVDGKDLIFYSMAHREDVNGKILDLLSNESKRAEVALHGYEKVKRDHTWDNRVEVLLHDLTPILHDVKAREIQHGGAEAREA